MEREVGEIFEYNGKWYQAVKSQGKCVSCDFMVDGHCIIDFSWNGSCFYCHRKDGENIIFKKLEKVGEPYAPINNSSLLLQRYQAYIPVTKINSRTNVHTHGVDNIIAIEIKQNKENMGEKKLNLKSFDLEAAKAGKPVCTRDGRKARIICFDTINKGNYPIIALLEDKGYEAVFYYNKDGKCNVGTERDLMMLPEKKEGWINLCKNNHGDTLAVGVFPSREEAVSNCPPSYLSTIKIEWEE